VWTECSNKHGQGLRTGMAREVLGGATRLRPAANRSPSSPKGPLAGLLIQRVFAISTLTASLRVYIGVASLWSYHGRSGTQE
jgi:hypothetical protein